MVNPKVSIIVPVYNVEKYLNVSLESLINQTLKEIEIILIDDGATDSSGTICDNYAKNDSRIKVFHNQNEGQGFSRNLGLKHAKGEYIAFIDSDDYIDIDFLEKLYNSAKEQNAEISCGNLRRFTNDGKISEATYNTNLINIIRYINYNCELLLYTAFSYGFYCRIYKKSFLEKYNIRFAEKLIYEDLFFVFLSGIYVQKIVVRDDVYYYYRVNHSATMYTARKTTKNFDILKIIELCENELEQSKYSLDINLLNKVFDIFKIIIYSSHLYHIDHIYFKKLSNSINEDVKMINLKGNRYNSLIYRIKLYMIKKIKTSYLYKLIYSLLWVITKVIG